MDGLPRVYESVVHMLADAVARSPQMPALVDGDRMLTYRDYGLCVAGFARELEELGARENRVAVLCGNSIEMAVSLFAIHAAGAQAVPLNPLYTERELRHILSDAEPRVVICDSDKADMVSGLADEIGIAHQISLGSGVRTLDQWPEEAAVLADPMPTAGMLATLQYTGGTTGLPKGVNIAHGPLAINISQREAFLPTDKGDERVLCVMPLFHVFAVSMCLHLAAYCHGTLVLLPRYHPDLVFDAIERHRITRLPAGPTIYNGLMAAERFGTVDFSSLKSAYSGSAPLPAETLRSWQAATGCPILEGYGQSEAGPVLTYVAEGMEAPEGSVGPALPETEIEIVDVDTGTTVLEVGKIGEIRARGPQIMVGYRNRTEATEEALRQGWLYTGDIGELDRNDHLYIRDRKKDMVITGGYNVYPREVDEVLYSHPDILEAASFGVADSYRGEILRAVAVMRPDSSSTPNDILEHCSRNLAKYKIPASIDFVTEIAKTPVGKVDRRALRAQAE